MPTLNVAAWDVVHDINLKTRTRFGFLVFPPSGNVLDANLWDAMVGEARFANTLAMDGFESHTRSV